MSSRLIRALPLTVVLVACGDPVSPPPPAEHGTAFATLLDSLRYALDLPALAGAIVTDDSIVYADAVGSRRYGGPLNVTAGDRFHLGSDGKAMTAALLGALVDDGLVAWSTTLATVFPEHAGSMQPEYRHVTVRDLLSHAGGFAPNHSFNVPAGSAPEQRAALVERAVQQPPAGSRGAYLYSNLGYIIAGAVAERVTGRAFEDLVVERLFEPLGMTTVGFGPAGTAGREDQPLPHRNDHEYLDSGADTDNPPVYGPAGRMHMTIGDWAKYARWVLAAEAGHQSLLRAETAAALTTGIVTHDGGEWYALGWNVVQRDWAGGRAITHTGSNGLNFAVAWLAPAKGFGVILATNQGAEGDEDPLDQAVWPLIRFRLEGR